MFEIKTDLTGLSSRAELWAAVIIVCSAMAFTAVVVPYRALFGAIEFWLFLGVVDSASGLLCGVLITLYLKRWHLPDMKEAAEATADTIRAVNAGILPQVATMKDVLERLDASTKAMQKLASLQRKEQQEQK